MPPVWVSEFEALTARDKGLVNEVCRRFEQSLHDDPTTRLESHLAGVPDELRLILFAELLFLECEARGRRVMSVDPAELARRFPGRADAITEVLAQLHRRATSSRSEVGESSGAADPAGAVPEGIGRFRPKAVLGRGGFGVVYRAHDPRDGRDVALKVPHLETLLTPELRRRFLREAEVARSLDHPNLVRVLDVGEIGLLCYIATEYVPGATLAGWMTDCRRRGEHVTAAVAARLIMTLAEAVHHAHERGILHCDIKPANILLPDGPDEVPRLVDFGLARLTGDPSELSVGSQVLGTPAYMAPEQAAGRRRDVTSRTDVYALGAVLYELLAGRPPFTAPSSVELLHRVLTDEPAPLRQFRPDVPADFAAVCHKCLAKNPEGRYRTAADLAADLHRFLRGEATEARPPGSARRLLNWVRRRPTAAGIILTATFAVLAAGIALNYHVARLDDANRDLTAALDERNVVNHQLAGEKERLAQRERALRRRAYASQMRQAQALLDRNERGELERVLREWEPAPGEEELRGFEWHYLSRRVGLYQVACLTPSEKTCYSLCYAPDGRTLAAGGADGCVRLLDPETGRELLPPLRHPDEVNQVVYSRDGRHLATACDDGKVRLWSAGGQLVHTWEGHGKKVHAVAFHPDGRSLASAGADGTCRLWAVGETSGSRVLLTRPKPLQSVSFNPEGTLLFVGGQEWAVHVCDPKTELISGPLGGQEGGVNAIRFGKAGDSFACADRGGGLTEWEAAPGVDGAAPWRVRSRVRCRFEGISGMSLSPDERFVAVAANGSVDVWSRGPLRQRWSFHGHDGKVWGVCFSPDGQRVATAGSDRTIRLWDFAAAAAREVPVSIGRPVGWLSVSDDGNRLVVTTDRMESWQRGDGRYVRVGLSHGTSLADAVVTDDGALRTIDQMKHVWDWGQLKQEAGGRAQAPDGEVHLAPTPVLQLEPSQARKAALDPAGRYLVVEASRELQVWELATQRMERTLTGLPSTPFVVAFGRSGRVAASASTGEVYLWDAETGRLQHVLTGKAGAVRVLAFSPSGLWLAGSGGDGIVTVWDASDGREVTRLTGHRGPVRTVAFSPDELTVVTGGADGTVRLWQRAMGLEAMLFADEDGPITRVAFSQNGRFVATAAESRTQPGQGVVRVHDCGHSLIPTGK